MELDYTKINDGISLKDLEVGDWFAFNSDPNKYYVYRVDETIIYYSGPRFQNSVGFQAFELDDKVKFLGKSKHNFWYKLLWWTDLVHPVKLESIKN